MHHVFVATSLSHPVRCVCVCLIYLWRQISDSVLAGGRAERAGRDGTGLSQHVEDTLESCWTLPVCVCVCKIEESVSVDIDVFQ